MKAIPEHSESVQLVKNIIENPELIHTIDLKKYSRDIIGLLELKRAGMSDFWDRVEIGSLIEDIKKLV